MNAWLLRFYVNEGQRCHGRPLWEWLLEEGNRLGLRGGSASRTVAGFGRHHHLHEERFFELAGTTALEVEFLVDDAEAQRLLAAVAQQPQRVFYAKVAAEMGVLNPDAQDLQGSGR